MKVGLRGIVAASLSVVLTAPGHGFADARGGVDLVQGPSQGLQCRSAGSRKLLLEVHGGTGKTEAAVAAGLQWIVAHQLRDGGWDFDHTRAHACGGKCDHPGSLPDARNAATGLALMALLGAGHTHQSGEHREAVSRGIGFLVKRIRVDRRGGSLSEPGGRMYSHGIASIALCEAYAMTRDKELRAPAQELIEFIHYAQDPVGGGWRYCPRQAGDTSVLGWQMAAVKAAKLGSLRVPEEILGRTRLYLDGVAADEGATYGYTTAGDGPATSAIGLLVRMQQGWDRTHEALQRGARRLAQAEFDASEFYRNYHTAQLLRDFGGDVWKTWNQGMQSQLLWKQEGNGHARGSWFVGGKDHGSQMGGRLYCTALAVLTLEVYYRQPSVEPISLRPSRPSRVLQVRPRGLTPTRRSPGNAARWPPTPTRGARRASTPPRRPPRHD